MSGHAKQEYVVDEEGHRKAVILPLGEYERLLEGLHDLALVAERRDEPAVSLADVEARLRADGLL
jgi:PHD/YefM family antitoxin component YafN of YafNO toxin-antitoxin module